jgi:hypothetical protein
MNYRCPSTGEAIKELHKLVASLAQRVEEQELVIDQRLTALEVSVNAEREELDLFATKMLQRVRALEGEGPK